ncbi:hypothetical protein AKO1_003180, partial [Acrasis kona]
MTIPAMILTGINYQGGKFNGNPNITKVRYASLENHYEVPLEVPILDIIGMLPLILFLVYFRMFAPKIKRTQRASDYSILVTRLPSDATSEEVKEHFSFYGQVYDATLALNNGKLIRLRKQQQEMIEQLKDYREDGLPDGKKRSIILGLGGDSVDSLSDKISKLQSEINDLKR